MNKFATKLVALAGAGLMALSMLPINTMAATTYTPVAGTSCNFNKYFIMDAGDSVPNATFEFTIAPGAARSASTADNDVMEVMAGVGTPTIANVTFGPSDSTATAAGSNIDVARTQEDRTGTAGTDTVQLDAGEKYATKQATVDFSSVSFNEPGIYRYIITEKANADHAAAGIIHDTDVDRVLDVYVTDDGTGALVVSSYVLHTDLDDVVINNAMGSQDVATAAAALDDKTDGFTNEYTSKDLVFKKEVTGNQASRDKYFEFTATLANVNDNDVYVVSLADDNDANTTDGNADATSGAEKIGGTIAANAGKTNPTSVTGAELKAGVKFYLQHGQSIAIRGIAPNATYTITENQEDYKKTASVVSGYEDPTTGVIGTIADSATVANSKAVMTSYQNQRDGIIPTGIVNSVILPAGIVLVALAGIAAFLITFFKKRRNDANA